MAPSPAFVPPRGAYSIEAHVVQSGAWFYVVGRDGGYVRAADEGDDEDGRPVSYGLRVRRILNRFEIEPRTEG